MTVDEAHKKFRVGQIDEDEMFSHCTTIIRHAISQSNVNNTDDSFQEASVSTLYCIRRYRGTENYSFLTMVYRKIKWDMIKHSWSDRLIAKPFYIYGKNIDRTHIDVISNRVKSPKGEQDLGDFICFQEPISETAIVLQQALIEQRDSRKRDILAMRIQGYSRKEIGSKYKLGVARVDQLFEDIKSEIKKSKYIAKDPLKPFTRNEIRVIGANMNIRACEMAEVLGKRVIDVYRLKTSLSKTR